MYKSRERDAPLRGARSFPFPPSFSANHRRPVTKRSPLFLAPAPSPPLFLPRRSFMCLYKPRTSANCSRRAYTCTYLYMCRVPLATHKNYHVDLKDVNCHFWKETACRNARGSLLWCGRGLLNVNYATSVSSNYSLPLAKRKGREVSRLTDLSNSAESAILSFPKNSR